MLKIWFGDMEEAIYTPSIFFDNTYEDEWITDELSKEMIRDVDKSEVLGPHCIQSPVLGQIPPTSLSGGVKTLMLLQNDDEHIFTAFCGDNCAKWILKIAEKKDLTINLRHIMDFGDGKFTAEILNNGVIITNGMYEMIDYAVEFLGQMSPDFGKGY